MQNDDVMLFLIIIGTIILSTILIPDMPFFKLDEHYAIIFRVVGFCFAELFMISCVVDYIDRGVDE